jgi:DNA invertase Pin-like site-specific DNA recombinase
MARKSRTRAVPRGQRIGYARVSTEDQNLALQIDALERAGCEIIFKDKGISGRRVSRPGLDKALASLKEGSDLVVWKIDRLGRDTEHLNRTARQLLEQGIGFQSICEFTDLATPNGRLLYRILAAFAEHERDMISVRTRAGMAAAKARGITLGRPRKLSEAQMVKARQMLAGGRAPACIVAKKFNVSPLTLARALKRQAEAA